LSNTGGILLLIVGGIAIYYVLSKSNLLNQKLIPENKVITENNKISVQGNVTPDIVTQLKTIIPNLQGSQVTSLIHGGTINTGYRGTNGKYYSSYEEALRNGAA
jgi:hypothetical protein